MSAIDYNQLWSEKYAARFAALREREEQFRAEAFVELPRYVAGEPLRVMTARDLHLLDGCGNAFVCGGVPDPGHLAAFLWQLHAARPAHSGILAAWRYGRFMGRLRRRSRSYLQSIEEVRAYLDFVFFDAPASSDAKEERRPFGGSFLVPLLGTLAAEFGAHDPVTGRPWGDVPLPQIFHWQKLAARRALGSDYIDRNPSDRVQSDFAAELNRLSAAA
jgi:hypothetical protein